MRRKHFLRLQAVVLSHENLKNVFFFTMISIGKIKYFIKIVLNHKNYLISTCNNYSKRVQWEIEAGKHCASQNKEDEEWRKNCYGTTAGAS